jgi:hypothetical protein
LKSSLQLDLHRICPQDKFHVDEDSTGHAPRDCAWIDEMLLSDDVSSIFLFAVNCILFNMW